MSHSLTRAGASIQHIAVIGGGRWARIIAKEVSGLVREGVSVTLYTNHDLDGARRWSNGQSGRPIGVAAGRPDHFPGMVAIVANAARDHAAILEWALDTCVPVLCEKPMTLTAASTARLMARAEAEQAVLCAGHVFRYASYLEALVARVRGMGPLDQVEIVWADPVGETRDGVVKTFDPSVPIYADLVPHIVSILQAFTPLEAMYLQDVKPDRGGAGLGLELSLAVGARATVELGRNAPRRSRIIRVVTAAQTLSLDFTEEPGLITNQVEAVSADARWGELPRPLSRMLASFLASVESGRADPRLSVNTALKANELIDQIAPIYRAALEPWTLEQLRVCAGEVGPDLRYQLEEILQINGRLPADFLAEQIKKWLQKPV